MSLLSVSAHESLAKLPSESRLHPYARSKSISMASLQLAVAIGPYAILCEQIIPAPSPERAPIEARRDTSSGYIIAASSMLSCCCITIWLTGLARQLHKFRCSLAQWRGHLCQL